MDKGLAQFLTEQRAYSLEVGGGSLFNVGVNPEYANDPARPQIVRMLVGSGPSHIPQATAHEALRPDLLPGGAALAAGYWADAHRSRAIGHGNVPSGNAALVRQLLTAGDYLDFTAAWLLDDIHANGDARPFQQRVLTLVPAFVNPLNSPRIFDVTRAIRAAGSGRLREDDAWADLWTQEDPPKPNMLFTKALVALDGDELAFLAASPAFKQLLGARSNQDVVAGFEAYAAGLAPTYDRLRKARATLGKL